MGILKSLLKGENLAQKNIFYWLGNDQPIVSEDNFQYIKEGYMSVGAVYECVDLIMKKVLACPIICYRIKSEQGYKKFENLLKSNNPIDVVKASKMKADVLEEVSPDNVQRLIDQPNPKQTWDEFISMIVALYLITGNSLVYGNASEERSRKKEWSEIWALPFAPDMITIESGGVYDPVKKYTINYNGGEDSLKFDADEIKHIKTINPDYSTMGNQLFGMSPLRPYISNLLADKFGTDQAAKILRNGMKFGMLTPRHKEDALSREQGDNLSDKLKEVFYSNEAMKRIIPGSIAMDYVPIGLDISDLRLLEISKASREDIYRAYHIPLTYAYNDSSTFNNKASDGKQFIYQAVAPVADAICKSLSQFICTPYNKDKTKYILKFDYMSLPEMSVDMKDMASWMGTSWWLSGDEKRYGMGYSELGTPELTTIYPPKNVSQSSI